MVKVATGVSKREHGQDGAPDKHIPGQRRGQGNAQATLRIRDIGRGQGNVYVIRESRM